MSFGFLEKQKQRKPLFEAPTLSINFYLLLLFFLTWAGRDLFLIGLISDERLARWRRLITSAAEQSRTPRMPTLVAPRTIPALIEDALQGSTKFDSVVYGCLPTDVEFAPQHASRFATSVKLPPKRLLICVGPEGGFTVDEKESLRSSLRAVAVFSSTNQLRVETAALSLVTIFANSWG